VDDSKVVVVKWYLSPRQHVIEMVLLHALLLPLIYWLSKKPWKVEVPALPRASTRKNWLNASSAPLDAVYDRARRKGGDLLEWSDTLLCVIAWITGPATVWYKMQNGRTAYLLQPCHLQNFVIMYLTVDGTSPFAAGLFHFYLCTSYGTLLALATPDLRGLAYPYEKEAFFLQHYVLLALPLVWVARRRYPLFAGVASGGLQGFYSILLTWASFFLVHLDVFWPASLSTLRNINYMMVPPPGPLREFGWAYRPVMGLACILLGVISRDVLAASAVHVAGLAADAQAEAAELSKLMAALPSPAGKKQASTPVSAASRSPLPPPTATLSSSSPRTTGVVGEEIILEAPVAAPASGGRRAGAGVAAGSDTEEEELMLVAPTSKTTPGRGRGAGTPASKLMGATVSSAAKQRAPSPAALGAVARRKSTAGTPGRQ